MSGRTYLVVAALAWAACSCGWRVQAVGAQEPPAPKLRVGTYDPRAVAVAYAASETFQKQLKQKMQELKEAEAKGDAKRARELKGWGESRQWLLHLQGFAGAPVDDILATVKDRLAAVAKAAGVAVITSKADYSGADVETVDITDQLVKLFNPSEKTLKTIRELRKQPPMEMAKVEEEFKGHGH
jgi:ribosomal protein L12E/L44/L45/RPP1/RPP2